VVAQIASGSQHSLALDNEGYVYAWGYAGYARLGLGDQKDKYVLILPHPLTPGSPQLLSLSSSSPIPCVAQRQYTPDQAVSPTIEASLTLGSIVVDAQGMFHIAGKWKMTGDGES
jgi:hypothetical protein